MTTDATHNLEDQLRGALAALASAIGIVAADNPECAEDEIVGIVNRHSGEGYARLAQRVAGERIVKG